VVEEADSERVAGVGDAAGEGGIFGARRGIAGRMGVKEDEVGGVQQECLLEDGPRIDSGAGHRATKDDGIFEQVVADVEIEGPEELLVGVAVAQMQIVGDGGRGVEELAVDDVGPGDAASELGDGEEGGDVGGWKLSSRKLGSRDSRKRCETAGKLEEVGGEGRIGFGLGRGEEESEKLGIVQGGGA
jgi:hypothetical protein